MSMPKHLISFTRPQYSFLKTASRRLGISIAEIVRRSVDEYRARIETPAEPEERDSKEEIESGFENAFGIWKDGIDGVDYKKTLRKDWDKRLRSWRG